MRCSCLSSTRPRRSKSVPELDPSVFAQRLRRLAVEAHALLAGTQPAAKELIELARCIDDLRGFARSSRMCEVDRWLQSARDRIEEKLRSSPVDPNSRR